MAAGQTLNIFVRIKRPLYYVHQRKHCDIGKKSMSHYPDNWDISFIFFFWKDNNYKWDFGLTGSFNYCSMP